MFVAVIEYLALGVVHGVVEQVVVSGVLVDALRRQAADYLQIGVGAHLGEAGREQVAERYVAHVGQLGHGRARGKDELGILDHLVHVELVDLLERVEELLVARQQLLAQQERLEEATIVRSHSSIFDSNK